MGMENNGEEMLKMFEQAMALSKAFGGGNNASGSAESANDTGARANGTDDMQKAAQAVQIYQLFKTLSEPSGEQSKQSAEKKQHEKADPKSRTEKKDGYYDEAIHTPELNSAKAAIPYLEYKYQRRVGVFVKLLELQKLMEMYSVEAAGLGGSHQGTDWRRGMLRAIHPHMPTEKKHMIELLIKFIDINEIMFSMKEVRAKYAD